MIYYNDPLYIELNKNEEGSLVSKQITNETITVVEGRAFLSQIPDIYYRITIDGMVEIDIGEEITSDTQFKCYYQTGEMFFSSGKEGNTINVDLYYGRGIVYYPASRIWSSVNGSGVTETLQDIISVGKMIWKTPVINYSDIATTYPYPVESWTVETTSDGKIYRYNGSSWEYVQQLVIGYTGSTGYTGSKGYTGSRGSTGYTGSQGTLGYTGSASTVIGYTGSKGDIGNIGYTGSASTVIGYTGSKGYTGSASTVIGYTGSKGDIGGIGYTGSASTVIGYTGSKGYAGSQGYTGSQGYAGSKGADGTSLNIKGSVATYSNLPPTGNVSGDGYVTLDTGHMWIWDGSQWVDTGGFVGYTGSRGYTGSQGTQGGIGYTGSASTVIGYTGSKGSTGSQGYTGSKGDIGNIGYTGSKGDVGDIGYTGSASTVIGYTGSKGSTGYTGSQGTLGYTGSASTVIGYTGSKGYTGSASAVIGYTGSQGIQGNIGYTGSQGVPDPSADLVPCVLVTSSRSLVISDRASILKCLSASAITINIPLNSAVGFPVNTEIVVTRYGAGTVNITGTSGVTIYSSGSKKSITNQYEAITLKKISDDEWLIIGSLST